MVLKNYSTICSSSSMNRDGFSSTYSLSFTDMLPVFETITEQTSSEPSYIKISISWSPVSDKAPSEIKKVECVLLYVYC